MKLTYKESIHIILIEMLVFKEQKRGKNVTIKKRGGKKTNCIEVENNLSQYITMVKHSGGSIMLCENFFCGNRETAQS